MNGERFFLDTAFVQAVLNSKDQHHAVAAQLSRRVQTAREVWTTEAILIEIGNALSAVNRTGAAHFIERAYVTANIRVVSVDTALLARAVGLYDDRRDKTWGMTDCISFIVMQEQGLQEALTSDAHFVQAGFKALLLRSSTPS